jgi:hypothetical protein
MPSETETLALHLATLDGRTAEFIVFAVTRGWVLVEAGQ